VLALLGEGAWLLSEKEYEETPIVWAVKVGRKCRWPDL